MCAGVLIVVIRPSQAALCVNTVCGSCRKRRTHVGKMALRTLWTWGTVDSAISERCLAISDDLHDWVVVEGRHLKHSQNSPYVIPGCSHKDDLNSCSLTAAQTEHRGGLKNYQYHDPILLIAMVSYTSDILPDDVGKYVLG